MQDAPFDACWHRWERADEVRQRVPTIWNDYIAEHPYDYSLDSRGGGEYIVQVWQTEPMPPEFAVAMGEWLYNLRSTLDYIMWATAVYVSGTRPPPNENHLQYPIYDAEKHWTSNLYRLNGLAPHHREMLKIMQPCHSDSDANFLGWINRLARIDRHRRLMDGTAYLAVIEPVFGIPDRSSMTLEWGERVLIDGRADVARIRVSPWDENAKVTVNPRVGIDPEIREWSESPFWGRMQFSERMKMMQTFVAAEIAVYEYDCTGGGRKMNLTTDSFREESDARREVRRIVAAPRPEVKWRVAEAGRRSNMDALMGKDFPTGPVDRRDWPSSSEYRSPEG